MVLANDKKIDKLLPNDKNHICYYKNFSQPIYEEITPKDLNMPNYDDISSLCTFIKDNDKNITTIFTEDNIYKTTILMN